MSLFKIVLLFSLLFYLLLWIISRPFFLGGKVSGTNLLLIAAMPFLIYILLYILQNSSVFQAKTPFGEISFRKVAQEIRISEAVLKLPTVPFEESYIAKGVRFAPREYVPHLLEEHPLCLTLTLGRSYDLEVLKEYLEVLEGFSFFKYVVFLQGDRRFIGFLPARDFHSLLNLFGPRIMDLLRSRDYATQSDPAEELRRFLHLQTQSVGSQTTADKVLDLMEKKHVKAVAVVDKKGHFKGITEAQDLLLLIVNRLVVKEKAFQNKSK